ncbi:MAG TPA: AMP-binding protein [Terrimicrobiaceae bacterium]
MSRISANTLADLYREAAERFGELPAFAAKDSSGAYRPISYRRLYEDGLSLATALIDLGLRQREHVGLLSDNRPEWILCDYGVLLAGCADVPRGTDVTGAEIAHILAHSDSRFVFVENGSVLEKFERVRHSVRGVEKIILMDPNASAAAGVLRLQELISRGSALRARGDRRAEERIANIRPEDLFTIIYTSGTTGTPKGVQLTHANMTSQVRNLPFDLGTGDRALTILPVWHSYERVFEMVAISMGACTYYTNLRSIGDDLKIVRPTVMASAPRLWENLYQKLMARIDEAPPLRRSLFHAARFCTCRVKRAERYFRGQELDMHGRGALESFRRGVLHLFRWIVLFLPYQLLDKIVLAKLREAVGCGDFRGTISGGGALQPHVDEFFNFIGIPVLEGYGLTESSPVLAVRTWENLVIGTVGPFYPETEIRIVDLESGRVLYPDRSRRDLGRGRQGEIHARGPQIMKGYYKDPEGTSRVFREGWLKTGDIGMVTFNDCLKIVGRCKDTIVLLNGENVEPLPIESKLLHSPLVDHCMIVGQDQKQLGALVVPALDGFRAAGLHAANLRELAASKQARALLEGEIRRLISPEQGFKSYERIADFRFVTKPFEAGQEMTATFKVKRHVISEKYISLIEEMYPSAHEAAARRD